MNFQNVSVKKALISVIKSIDLYNYLLKNHHRRTAIIAYQLGNRIKDKSVNLNLSHLVLAASLHDVGALNIKERDQLLHVDVEDPSHHEKLGAYMLEGFEPFNEVSRIIYHHHINYKDVLTHKVAEEEVPYECYILHLADRIEILSEGKSEDLNSELIIDKIIERFGSVFHPNLKDVFLEVIREKSFWENLKSQSYHELLYASMQGGFYEMDLVEAENLALIFAKLVDMKSPWTNSHSQCVSAIAYQLGRFAGLDKETCFKLRLAGYLHDIGKIATPTELLDKTSELTSEEYRRIKEHAMFTSLILKDIEGLEEVAAWASAHHERRDYSGYPLQLSEENFDEPLDILIFADVLSALLESRPYRPRMSDAKIHEVLHSLVPEKLSAEIYMVLKEHFDELKDLHERVSLSVEKKYEKENIKER